MTLIGHNLAVYLGTYTLEGYLVQSGWERTELWATLFLTPFGFVFAETTPKQLGYAFADRYCASSARVLQVSSLLFLPLAAVLGAISRGLQAVLSRLGRVPVEPTRRDEILAHLEMGTAEGLLDPTQHSLATHVMAVERRPVNAVMTPLGKIAGVKKSTPCARVRALMQETGLRRVPVVDKRKQRVLGVVSTESLLLAEVADEVPAGEAAQPPVILPTGTPLGRACAKLQGGREKLGVVVAPDERALGIVTAQDLVAALLSSTGRPPGAGA
jgi:CBS domain containing-hemolysin-like protein